MSQPLIDQIQQSYDETPYQSHPFPQSTPEHLQAVGHLFGLRCPAPATARVLELGCSAGGNLVPFALRHPGAQALGLDLSAVHVAQGQQRLAALGLQNLRLQQADIAQVAADPTALGEFDYIICHGVYSWVPPVVQDAILRLCGRLLSPKGVAYVSYNTYPGWKVREIVRDAMMLRAQGRVSADEKLAYGRGMLDFMAQMSAPGSVLRHALDEVLPTIRNGSPYYLIHDFLEPCNAPCYLRDFVHAARGHGLDYLGDAEPNSMFVGNFGAQVAEPLLKEVGGDQLLMEQYLDFLTNRQFRQTLLVRSEHKKAVRYRLDASRLQGLHFAGTFERQDPPAGAAPAARTFATRRGQSLVYEHLMSIAALQALDQAYPATLDLDALCEACRAQAAAMGLRGDVLRAQMAVLLEGLLIGGHVRYACAPVHCASAAQLAAGTARAAPWLALHAGEACNVWHEPVPLGAVELELLGALGMGSGGSGAGGTEGAPITRATLHAHLLQAVAAGHLRFLKDGQVITEPPAIDAAALAALDSLESMRRRGLLV